MKLVDYMRAHPQLGLILLGALVVLLASFSARWSLFACVVALGVLFAAHRRNGESGSHEVGPRRLGSCVLGPGASVHLIAIGDRQLVLGVTNRRVTVLDRDLRCDPANVPRPVTQPRAVSTILALACCLAAVPAFGAQHAPPPSSTQSVDLAPPGDTSAARPAPRTGPDAPGIQPLDRTAHQLVEPVPIAPIALLALLAVLPFLFMSVTSFVKVSVVLSLVRTALGTPQVPSDPVLAGIALSISICVMGPVVSEALDRARSTNTDPSTLAGITAMAAACADPLRGFLRRNTRPEEIAMFAELSAARSGTPADTESVAVLVPAFVTSELRQAFVTGFILFIPFLVVDMVVANILMSMGMIMVSPNTVSMPFKLMLFVLIDGWPLLMKGLALSYR